MFLKKFKFKFLILSAFLLTIASGLLFYRQLYRDEIKNEKIGRIDLDEMRYIDSRLNQSMLEMRTNLNLNSDEILSYKYKMNDLLNIILDMRKSNKEIQNSLNEIKVYFEEKSKNIDSFLVLTRELQASLKSLNSIYLEIQKQNIKFMLDGKDFYRECITDSLMYLIAPSKDVEWKLNENIKIITQIIAFAKKPVPTIEKYYKAMETIRNKSLEINNILSANKEKNIEDQIKVLMKYDSNIKEMGQSREQTFFILLIASIIIYILAIVFVFKTL